MSPRTAAVRRPRGLLLYAVVVCLFALVAAGLSFANGSWLGVVWLLMAAVTSNVAWYYARNARRPRR